MSACETLHSHACLNVVTLVIRKAVIWHHAVQRVMWFILEEVVNRWIMASPSETTEDENRKEREVPWSVSVSRRLKDKGRKSFLWVRAPSNLSGWCAQRRRWGVDDVSVDSQDTAASLMSGHKRDKPGSLFLWFYSRNKTQRCSHPVFVCSYVPYVLHAYNSHLINYSVYFFCFVVFRTSALSPSADPLHWQMEAACTQKGRKTA